MDLGYATPATRTSWNVGRMVRRAGAVAVPVLILLLTVAFPGVIYRQKDEVDIRSGRIRRSHYVFSVQTSQTVEDSAFTKTLPPTVKGAEESDWHLVNTFEGTSQVSPHYSFHGAISQIRILDLLWQLLPFTDEAKQEVVNTVLKLWQSDGSYFSAEAYIRSVENAASQFEGKPGRHVTVADLPPAAGTNSPTTQP